MRDELVTNYAARPAGVWDTKKGSNAWYTLPILLLWSAPVVLTLLSIPDNVVVATTAIAAVVSAGLILVRPEVFLVALPFFGLLSPIAGFWSVFGLKLLLSDLLFIFLAIHITILFLTDRMRFSWGAFLSLPMSFSILFVVSSLAGLSLNSLTSLKPVLYLFQLTIVYVYTARFAADEEGRWTSIRAWLVASGLGALLLIHAYFTGRPLIEFKVDPDSVVVDVERLQDLFRATYYYAGFHLILGIAIVVSTLELMLGKARSAFVILLLPLLLAALLLMMAKTAIISVLLAVLAVLTILWSVQRRKALRAVAYIAVVVGVVYVAVFGMMTTIGDVQGDFWTERAISVGSLEIRLKVFAEALSAWLSAPLHIVVGMGPDFLDSSGNPQMTTDYKFSPETGVAEGTVDSGWISYLIELGVIGFTVLVSMVVTSVQVLLRSIRQMRSSSMADGAAIYVLGSLLFLIAALSTQMLGYSKLTWWPLQLLAIGLMYDRRSYTGVRE